MKHICTIPALGMEMDTGQAQATAQAAPNALQAYEWTARPASISGNAIIQLAVISWLWLAHRFITYPSGIATLRSL